MENEMNMMYRMVEENMSGVATYCTDNPLILGLINECLPMT